LLIISSILYFVSSRVMLWSPNVYILLFARLLDGLGIGLAVTLVPLYISETTPLEIKGLLITKYFSAVHWLFWDFLFLLYGLCYVTHQGPKLDTHVGCYFNSLSFILHSHYSSCLPESPRWLVSIGRMLEAKNVLLSLLYVVELEMKIREEEERRRRGGRWKK